MAHIDRKSFEEGMRMISKDLSIRYSMGEMEAHMVGEDLAVRCPRCAAMFSGPPRALHLVCWRCKKEWEPDDSQRYFYDGFMKGWIAAFGHMMNAAQRTRDNLKETYDVDEHE